MNKDDIIEELRSTASLSRELSKALSEEDREAAVVMSLMADALALAIEQGGGCICGPSHEAVVPASHTGIPVTGMCQACHGTGISPELAKLLAELGVGDESS